MSDGTTHYEGCWESGAKHYACVVRELADCSAAFDRQQEMLDRNAEQIATLRLEVEVVVEKNRVLCELLAEAEKKAWVELTKEELQTIFNYEPNDIKHIAFLVESLCKEKNGG